MAARGTSGEEPTPSTASTSPKTAQAGDGAPAIPSLPDAPAPEEPPESAQEVPSTGSGTTAANEADDEPDFGLITQVKQGASVVAAPKTPVATPPLVAVASSPTYQGAVQSRPSNAPPKSPPRRSRGFFSSLFACCTCGTAEDIESDRSVPPAVPARVEGVAAIPAKAEAEAARIRAGDVLNSGAGSLDSLNGNGTKQQDRKWLLRPAAPEHRGKKCLVLDLDETLVHSSFKAIPHADFVIPVEIESQVHNVYVLKRPYVDPFLKRMSEIFEIVVFTASLAKYADPVLDILDKHKVVNHRLFREACIHHKGNYVKDLSQLGRDLRSVIIIDNSPASYMFHNNNAIPITSWFNDINDTELLDLIPFLEDLNKCDNVQLILDQTTSE